MSGRWEQLWSKVRGEQRPLAVFTYSVLGFLAVILGWDSYIMARTMQSDPFGYPVRLIIPEPKTELAKRAPPQLMGENATLVSAALADMDGIANSVGAGIRSGLGDFEQAFAGTPIPSTRQATVQSAPKVGKTGMLKIDFDLNGGVESAKVISVKKPVAVAGNASGDLSIRIDGAAKIYARRSEVASLIDGKSPASERVRNASNDEFVSFTQLRDWGVDIRYDPSGDRILIPLEG